MSLGNVFVRSVVREVGRNYKHQLEKICKTWTIKGPTATFNVAQNMYKSFFDLVEEAQADGDVDVKEVIELMTAFSEMRPQLKKVEVALEQL